MVEMAGLAKQQNSPDNSDYPPVKDQLIGSEQENEGKIISIEKQDQDKTVAESGPEGHSHDINGKVVLVCGVNITPLALVCALGFHSIFEGIAMGIMTDLNAYINLMVGVTIHHIVSSIALGVSL